MEATTRATRMEGDDQEEAAQLDEAAHHEGRTKRPETDEEKKARLEREALELVASVRAGSTRDLKARVAGILNQYQHTRDSDIALALKYWEVFQPEYFNPRSITPDNLFRLERQSHIIRVRQKVQNEYGLFQADAGIRTRRKEREDEIREAVIEDGPGRRTVHVFADETGKNAAFAIVAAVWVLTGRAVYDLGRAIDRWRDTCAAFAKREMHFAELKRTDFEALQEYLEVLRANREFLGFKVIATERAQLRGRRNIDEVITKLYEHMLIQGVQHELANRRVTLPQNLIVTLDEIQSLDPIARADLRRDLTAHFHVMHGDELGVDEIITAKSHHSPMIQLADLVAGAVGRKRNHTGERNHKDDMADLIIDRLNLQFEENEFPGIDSSVWISL